MGASRMNDPKYGLILLSHPVNRLDSWWYGS